MLKVLCDYVITRNKKDFIGNLELEVLTPEEFLKNIC